MHETRGKGVAGTGCIHDIHSECVNVNLLGAAHGSRSAAALLHDCTGCSLCEHGERFGCTATPVSARASDSLTNTTSAARMTSHTSGDQFCDGSELGSKEYRKARRFCLTHQPRKVRTQTVLQKIRGEMQMAEAAEKIRRQIVVSQVGDGAKVRDQRAVVRRAQHDRGAGRLR